MDAKNAINPHEVSTQKPAMSKEKLRPTSKGHRATSDGSSGVTRLASMSGKINKQGNKVDLPERQSPGIRRANTELNNTGKERFIKPRQRASSSQTESRKASEDLERENMAELQRVQGEEEGNKIKDEGGRTSPTQILLPSGSPPDMEQKQEDEPALLVFPIHGVNFDKGASPQHQSIMDEIRIKRQQQLEAMRQKAEDERQANIVIAYPDFSDDESVDDDKEDEAREKISPLRQAGLRAWAIIRRNISEVAMERKNKESTLNWSFLRQTIKRMTDMEKGRQELYDRYLLHPDDWKDGIINKHLLKGLDSKRFHKNSDSETSASPSPSKGLKSAPTKSTKAR